MDAQRRDSVVLALMLAGSLPVMVAVGLVAPGFWFLPPIAVAAMHSLVSERRVRVAMRRELEVILGGRRDV